MNEIIIQDVVARTTRALEILGISPSEEAIRAFIHREAEKEMEIIQRNTSAITESKETLSLRLEPGLFRIDSTGWRE